MELMTIILMAVFQGIAEFLPISSSAHLLIFQHFFKQFSDARFLTIVMHLGTALAVLVFYYKDIGMAILSAIHTVFYKHTKPQSPYLFHHVIISTIPVIVVGLFVSVIEIDQLFSNLYLMLFNLIFFGILLYLVDKYAMRVTSNLHELTVYQSLMIGIGQVLALMSGVSRLGVTLTFARWAKLTKPLAIKYAILLSLPVSLGAVILELITIDTNNFNFNTVLIGVGITFAVAYISLQYLIQLLIKLPFAIFMWYRVLIAIIAFCIYIKSM